MWPSARYGRGLCIYRLFSVVAVPAPHGVAEMLPSFGREEASLARLRCLALVSLDEYSTSLVPGCL